MRWLLTGLTAALVPLTVILPATPAAAAAIEDHFHVASSNSNSWPERSATVTCPPGQIVWGFGGLTIGGTGHAALVELYPDVSLASVTAVARVRDGWLGPWTVIASATCWPPGSVGLQRVVDPGGVSAHASCPGAQKVYASGFVVTAQLGEAYVAAVEPDPNMTGVTVRAGGAEPIGLATRAIALCGLTNTQQIYRYERTQDRVPIDPGPSTSGEAPQPVPWMPTPDDRIWITGAGASSSVPYMFIDALGPVAGLNAGMARMSRVATPLALLNRAGVEGGEGEVTVYGTCIGAWY